MHYKHTTIASPKDLRGDLLSEIRTILNESLSTSGVAIGPFSDDTLAR